MFERIKGMIESAKNFVGQVKEDISGLGTARADSLKAVRERQGPGFWMGDIGEDGRSNEPAHGPYEHNSPAKPL